MGYIWIYQKIRRDHDNDDSTRTTYYIFFLRLCIVQCAIEIEHKEGCHKQLIIFSSIFDGRGKFIERIHVTCEVNFCNLKPF
jgi:hypothetical protein